MVAQKNGNGAMTFIARSLVVVVVALLGIGIQQINSKADTIKADSSDSRIKIEARVDKNQADIIRIGGDVRELVVEQRYMRKDIIEILTLLKEKKDTT